jgi:sec-independent protein translocase protein TatC
MFFRLLSKLFNKREEGAGPKQDGDVVKPFLDHLEDLRWTIVKMVVTLVVGMAVCFVFAADIVKLLQWPIHQAGIPMSGSSSNRPAPPPADLTHRQDASPKSQSVTIRLINRMIAKNLLSPEEGNELIIQARQDELLKENEVDIRSPTPFNAIMTGIQISFYAAITLTMPLLLYFLGEFVMPALTKKEKSYILPALGVGFVLFLGGIAFSFIQVMPGMLKFLHGYTAKMGIKDMWDLKTYCSFVAHLCIAFGLLCELPVLMVTLNFIGVVEYKTLASTRVYAFTGILVLCAIVSPSPDLVTLFMLAAPLAALYEGCIWIVYFLDKRRAREERRRELELDDRHPDEPID